MPIGGVGVQLVGALVLSSGFAPARSARAACAPGAFRLVLDQRGHLQDVVHVHQQQL